MHLMEIDEGRQRETEDRPTDSIVEVPVLLETGLLHALESAARRQGTTAGSLVRRLLRDFLDDVSCGAPVS